MTNTAVICLAGAAPGKEKKDKKVKKEKKEMGMDMGTETQLDPGAFGSVSVLLGLAFQHVSIGKKTAFQWPKSEKNTSRILKGGVMWCVFSAKEKVEKKSGKPSPSHVPAPRGMDRSTSLAEKGNKVTCHCDNQTGRTDDYLDFIPAVTSYFSMKSLFKHCIICIHQGMVPGHLP